MRQDLSIKKVNSAITKSQYIVSLAIRNPRYGGRVTTEHQMVVKLRERKLESLVPPKVVSRSSIKINHENDNLAMRAFRLRK
jgi:hypothetical protein